MSPSRQLEMFEGAGRAPAILAYAAGLIDGEGHIGIVTPQRGKGNHYRLQVEVRNTDARLVKWLHDEFGGSVMYVKRVQPRHRPVWIWTVQGRKAELFLRSIRPYLIGKAERADVGFALRELIAQGNNSLSASNLARRADLRARLKVLNRRGVVESTTT